MWIRFLLIGLLWVGGCKSGPQAADTKPGPASDPVPNPVQTYRGPVTLAAAVNDSQLELTFTNHTGVDMSYMSHVRAGAGDHYDWTRVLVIDDQLRTTEMIFYGNRDYSIPTASVLPGGGKQSFTIDLLDWADQPINQARLRFEEGRTYHLVCAHEWVLEQSWGKPGRPSGMKLYADAVRVAVQDGALVQVSAAGVARGQ